MQREQDLSDFKALLLQKYAFETQAIIDILSVMISSGIAWNDIKRMVKEERKQNNQSASKKGKGSSAKQPPPAISSSKKPPSK